MSCNCYLTSQRFLKRNHSCVVLGESNIYFISLELVVFLPMFISFCAGVACRGFNFAQELLCTTRVSQPKDLRRDKSILIILPTQGKKHILQCLFRRSASLIHASPWASMHGNCIQYWVNPIPPQFSLHINPNWNFTPSFLTLIIKLLGHWVFMGAIQCSPKRVYPPKDFRYHLLTKNHHQYLKESFQ